MALMPRPSTNQSGDGDSHSQLPVLSLVFANLMPLFGVLFLGWALIAVLLMYWLETLVICAVALLRMFRQSGASALGSALIFLLAFITLSAAHLAVIVVLAEALDPTLVNAPDLSTVSDQALFSSLGTIYTGGLAWIADDWPMLLMVGLPVVVVNQLIGFLSAAGRADDRWLGSAQAILRQALSRVVLLHLALLLGSAVIAALGFSDLLPVLALLALLKLWFDLRAHRQAERVARPAVGP